MIPTIEHPCKCIEVPSKDTPGSVTHHSTISRVIHLQRHSKNGSIFEPGLVIRRFLWTQWHASNRFLWIQWSWGSIYIHPELMGEVELVKFTTYMVILDGGSVWKFWPYWSIFSWNQPYMLMYIHVMYVYKRIFLRPVGSRFSTCTPSLVIFFYIVFLYFLAVGSEECPAEHCQFWHLYMQYW